MFSDTVNTGIYVMEPEVFDYVEADTSVDWSGDVFPQLMKEGKPVYGYIAEGYWEDVGTHESYVKAQADVLEGKVDVEIDGFEISPGVWVAEGAEVDPEAVLRGPLYIGDYAKVEAGVEIREHTVIGSNVVVKTGAFLHKAVVHDNVYIGPQTQPARLRHRQEHRRDAGRPDRRRRGDRRRVPDRRGVDHRGQRAGLPVQDDRGRRVRQHLGDLGVPRAGPPVRRARASPGS